MKQASSRPSVATDAGPFAIVPLWVIERLNEGSSTAAAVSVLVSLHHWTDSDRYGYPSHASIAKVANISVASVKRGIKALEEIGALVVVPRWLDHDGQPVTMKPETGKPERTSNGYFIRYADPHREPTSGQIRTHPLGQIRTHPSGQIRPSNQTQSEPDPVEPEISKAPHMVQDCTEVALVEIVTDDDFSHFWGRYPRRTQKANALRSWSKLKSHDRIEALARLPEHVAWWQQSRTEPQFVPHPATWINQRRWEDQLPDLNPPGLGMSRAAQTIQEMMRNATDGRTENRGLSRRSVSGMD